MNNSGYFEMNALCIKYLFGIVLLSLAFSPLEVLASETASASGANTTMITNVLCNIVGQLTGGIGRVVVMIIAISMGIMLLLGKVTWGVFLAFAVGCGIIFGARDIVNVLSGGGEAMCVS